MARKRRVWIPDKFYHITSRGNRRDPLFRTSYDYRVFFSILEEVHERTPFELASYCLMTNHFHLQLRSKEQSISKVMSLVKKRYADYYNNRYRLSGHVFEKRFFDKAIYDEEDMIRVSTYIHLNPFAAQIVNRPEHYPWSSYRYFKYPLQQPPSYVQMEEVLQYYGGTPKERKEQYCREVEKVQHAQSLQKK